MTRVSDQVGLPRPTKSLRLRGSTERQTKLAEYAFAIAPYAISPTVIVRHSRPKDGVASARLCRTIQYSRDVEIRSRGRGVLDCPPEPVIGLAKGETGGGA